MYVPPTPTQQMALAYAPKPPAVLSFLSSVYVIHHLLRQRARKLSRLYHRLVLAMEIAVGGFSLIYIWGTWAVPEGTPDFVGAVGNIHTCTSQGFLALILSQTVPLYYGSLSLQAAMAIRHKFMEEKYVWIEKWFHLAAFLIPCGISAIAAATDNINPSGSTCFFAKAPRGCENDPSLSCERGEDVRALTYALGVSQLSLYFVFPPAGALGIYLWIKGLQKDINGHVHQGMKRIKEKTRLRMLSNVAVQISLYLFAFWFTFALSLINHIRRMLTGQYRYNLLIMANVIVATQGFILSIVYFALERMSKRGMAEEGLQLVSIISTGTQSQLSVSEIRHNARTKSQAGEDDNEPVAPCTFHIFDGTPDEDSPWAKFFEEEDDDNADSSCGVGPTDS